MINKTLILNELQEHYKCKKDKDFAELLGISSQILSNWKSRNTFDIDILYTKCENINPVYLLTGKGEIELQEKEYPTNESFMKLSEPGEVNELVSAQKKTITILEREVEDLRNDKSFLKNVIENKMGKEKSA